MGWFPKEIVYPNDSQRVSRNHIPVVNKEGNPGILEYFTQLKSNISGNNTMREMVLFSFLESQIE